MLIKGKGLRVTPQRVIVLEALFKSNHPTVEKLSELIYDHHPNIAIGTIYKVLETFVEKGLANRVPTDLGVMRYDAVTKVHHHLYCSETDRIEDFYDEDLDALLKEYFEGKEIEGFNAEEFKIQLIGKFNNKHV
jgi:Fur family peroxide stress response transcriptional regulator